MKCIVSLILMLGAGSSFANAFATSRGVAREIRNVNVIERCSALLRADFSSVADAPTQVTASTLVDATHGTPAYCEVQGYVASDVGFALWLPAKSWNGQFIELGCGGSCGSTQRVARCAGPLRRGYACIVSDGGHKSNGFEMKWAYENPQAVIDYIVRASHVTAIAGRAIVSRYYSRDAQKSYFWGCSAGGIQAMWEAQKFPWDFNGILAGDPALRLSDVWMNWLWDNRALMGIDGRGILGKPQLALMHRAVVANCDMNDGVKDGVIGDPRLCHVDPLELQCARGVSKKCLTAIQVAAVRKIYDGPSNSKGKRIARPIALRGSELSWLDWFGGSTATPTPIFHYFKDWFYYSIFPIDLGQDWKPEDVNFNSDYKRLGAMSALEPNNPDLRRFKAVGGKLIVYTGWSDAIEGVLNTVDYYDTVERVMGGRAITQSFFRLFVVPGMNHCTEGDGPFAVDWLTYLAAWVENGKAPDKVVGYHVRYQDLMDMALHGDRDAWREFLRRSEFPLDHQYVEFSRPIYSYPVRTKYLGHGDPTQAASFGPTP